MLTFQTPIVGARFRPPADQVLNLLPQGEKLLCQRDPTNPYDSNAIKVLLLESPSTETLLGSIYQEADATWQDPVFPFHLGFVPAKMAEDLAAYLDAVEGECDGELTFNLEGRPEVILKISEAKDDQEAQQ